MIANWLGKRNRGLCRILLPVSLLCLLFVTYAVYTSHEAEALVIEDLSTGRTLWQLRVKEGDEFHYQFTHSFYNVEVYHRYKVTPNDGLTLVSVTSSPVVLFSPYPGYELPLPLENEGSGELVEVTINKQRKTMVIAVGDEVTDKTLIIRQQSLKLRQIAGDAAVVRVYLSRTCRWYWPWGCSTRALR